MTRNKKIERIANIKYAPIGTEQAVKGSGISELLLLSEYYLAAKTGDVIVLFETETRQSDEFLVRDDLFEPKFVSTDLARNAFPRFVNS